MRESQAFVKPQKDSSWEKLERSDSVEVEALDEENPEPSLQTAVASLTLKNDATMPQTPRQSAFTDL